MGLGACVDTTRVFGYAEYDVMAHQCHGGLAPHVEGHLFSECGFRGLRCSAATTRSGDGLAGQQSGLIQAFTLPNSSHVDRTLCAEYQILDELCGVLATVSPHGRREDIVGVVYLFTTTSPCLSCLGAIRQFQLLFPEVSLEASELCDEEELPSLG